MQHLRESHQLKVNYLRLLQKETSSRRQSHLRRGLEEGTEAGLQRATSVLLEGLRAPKLPRALVFFYVAAACAAVDSSAHTHTAPP